jgi:hypothetical protein
VLLVDRVHTGEPFLQCLDDLEWYYVFRASESTQIEHPTLGWMPLKRVYKRANQGRYLSKVPIWKQGERQINISIYKLVRKGFRTTIWYIVSDLPAAQERLAEYACRWRQECTFKDCKSNMFDWERPCGSWAGHMNISHTARQRPYVRNRVAVTSSNMGRSRFEPKRSGASRSCFRS